MSEPDKHYLLSPSGSSRWLECPGSLAYANPEHKLSIAVDDDRDNKYSLEGTAAHTIAYEWLENDVVPEVVKFCNRCDHRVTEVAACQNCGGTEYRVDDEMVEYVGTYVEFVETIRATNEVLFAADEVQLIDDRLEDFGGTVDSLTYYRNGLGDAVLMVADLKYGAGVQVSAVDNTQLLSYLLLAMQRIARQKLPPPDLLIGVIVQPRGVEKIKEIYLEPADLNDFRERVLLAYADGTSDDPTFLAGDHCYFCPFAINCPTLEGVATEVALTDFQQLVDNEPVEKLAELYSKRKAVDGLFNQIAGKLQDLLEKGVDVPGYKLVKSLGNRRWVGDDPTDAVVRRLRKFGAGKRDITKTELMSPAQVEKLYPDAKAVVAELCERPDRGLALAPVSDRRAAVEVTTPQIDFERI